jgi:preprotein translocase subunit SecD
MLTLRTLVLVVLHALLLSACGGLQPVRNPLQVRMEEGERGPEAQELPYLCRDGTCTVGQRVYLDERDVRGASLLQEGETQGLLVLEFSPGGEAKLNLLARSNLGRRMVFVQEGKVLGTALIEKPETSGKVQLLGPLPDMRRIFKELTEPKPK